MHERQTTIVLIIITIMFYMGNGYIIYKTTQVKCESNPLYFDNVSCKLKPINRYKATTDLAFHLIEVLRNVSLQFETFVKNDANQYYPFVVNAQLNACKTLARLDMPILHRVIRKLVSTMSNINHSCPYRGWILGRNAFLNEKLLPPVVAPVGDYKGIFRLMEGYPQKSIVNFTAFVQIMDIRKDEFERQNN